MSIICPKCHFDNPDETAFCGKCGTKFTAEEKIAVTETLQAPREELTTGSTFAGRYQIIEELGKGGMGKVYKALDKEINAKIALKLIKPEIASDRSTIERFRNELKTARDIVHKNVCRMYDLNKEEGSYYITMEYVSGEDLKSFIRRAKRLDTGTAVAIAKQVSDGLTEAHVLGVVHRDLKPSNIMIDRDGNARIMDFGIARSLTSRGITDKGVMIGTPDYMSPEQVEGKDIDQRTDIYSLGIILYEMVTGKVPFEGETALSIAHKHKYEIPLEPKTINPQIPDALNSVIMKCLEKEKDERYQSAGEVRAELENIEKGIPTTDRVIPKKKPLTSKEITVTLGWKKLFIPGLVILMLGTIAYVIFRKPGLDLDPKRIVVAIFDNQTGDPSHDPIGRMAADWITQGLAQTGLVEVVPSVSVEKVISGYEGENPIRFLAQKMKAGTVISGSYYIQGDSIQFHVQATDTRKGRLLKALAPVRGPINDPSKLIEALRQQLMVDLSILINPVMKEWARFVYMPPLYEAYKEFGEGNNFFTRGEYKQAIDHYLKAASLDHDFVQPKLWAATAYGNLGDVVNSHALVREVDKFRDKLSQGDRFMLDSQKAGLRGDLFGIYQAWVQIAKLPKFIPYFIHYTDA